MANYKELENKKNDILLNMEHEEIIALFDNLSDEEMNNLDSFSIKEGFKPVDVDGLRYVEDLIYDTNKILKTKYNYIEGLSYISRFGAIFNKYIDTMEEVKVLFFSMGFLRLYYIIMNLEHDINSLYEHLNLFYILYYGKDEELANDIETTFNMLLERIIKNIEFNIDEFNKYSFHDPEVNISEKSSDELDLKKIIEDTFMITSIGNDLINKYNEIKLNPFEEGIRYLTVTYLSIIFNEDVIDLDSFEKSLSDEKDLKVFNVIKQAMLINLPSYDFENFKLVFPENN